MRKIFILLEEKDVDIDLGTIETLEFYDLFDSYGDIVDYIKSLKYYEYHFNMINQESFDKYDKEKYGKDIEYVTDVQSKHSANEYRYFIVLSKTLN